MTDYQAGQRNESYHTYRTENDAPIERKSEIRDLGIIMNNEATFTAWPTIDTALFFAFSRLKIDGVHLMGIDRRKIENRYKSGNKSSTTRSFNLGFLYDHHQFVIFHSVK